MMGINAGNYVVGYDFEISGASYIGAPRSNTIMYISRKIGEQLHNLENVKDCLVFAETGTKISKHLKKYNAFVVTDNPQLEYAKLAKKLYELQWEEDRRTQIILSPDGYYYSEKAHIGENAYIDPGCFIGHHVTIGNDAVILMGTVIKNAMIGNNFLANENVLIGVNGFTMTKDEKGNYIRIPSLGNDYISNNVEIGAHNNISRGSGSATIIEEHVKLDAFVHIGHDAHIHKNVQVVAGVIVGGFDVVEENAYLGLHATLKNRISIGCKSIIGMGANVLKSVAPHTVYVGNPAKELRKIE